MSKTLLEFLSLEEASSSRIRDELAVLISQIAEATKRIAAVVGRAGLTEIRGATGSVNVQDEEVKHLDQFAHDVFLEVMMDVPLVERIASEEEPELITVAGDELHRRYTILVDPLDGSSNADINGVVGTIFSIRRRSGGRVPKGQIIGKGAEQLAAGYAMYGPSTMFVWTGKGGVHGFTLDTESGDFMLSHEDMKMPERAKSYAINHGNRSLWFPPTAGFINEITSPSDAPNRPCSQRWVGALVADFHRILLDGGIYLYPADRARSEGKLRLLYECAPLALIAERAGGLATTGTERILDVRPADLHQRVPLIIGSRQEVELAESYYQR